MYDFRTERELLVGKLQKFLAEQQRSHTPRGIVVAFMVPMFLYLCLSVAFKIALRMVVGVIGKALVILAAPFVALYIWIDLTLILLWFFVSATQKLGKESK